MTLERSVFYPELAQLLWTKGIATLSSTDSIQFRFYRETAALLTSKLFEEFVGAALSFSRLLRLRYKGVCGIPNAGKELAAIFGTLDRCPRIEIEKDQKKEGNSFSFPTTGSISTNGIVLVGSRVVLFDEAVASRATAVAAADLLRGVGFTVKDVLVFVDCGVGGQEELAQYDLSLHALWRTPQLIDFWWGLQLMKGEDYDRARAYLARHQNRPAG
jgi:orotate phosphoribosyltransferase